ncbi:MAG: 3-isopropylmalate dehydrogenase [Planctomycetota bacterium]|nr:3-isopropylmalate dehydrogenase [Planctomycetota bacterium]
MYRFAIMPGDGIGPEIVREGMKSLEAASEIFGFKYEAIDMPYGTDHYLDTGVILPDGVFDELRQMDAIFLGAIGDPRVETGLIERHIIAGVRFTLDLYINLRPIQLYAEHLCPLKGISTSDIDFTFVRENTEGAYAQLHGFFKKGTADEISTQQMLYTRKGVERTIRYAFDLCKKRNKKNRLTLVDKANALRSHDIWTRTFEEVAKEYPDIETDHAYVDACGMWMLKNPNWFDVIVTTNLFGDILSDIGAMLQGGLGIAAGGNIHPGQVSMFEPIHGSAPKYAGKNVANPLATILSAGLMLDHVGESEAALAIERTVQELLASGKVPDLSARSGLKTDQIGDMVVEELRASQEARA